MKISLVVYKETYYRKLCYQSAIQLLLSMISKSLKILLGIQWPNQTH